MIKLLTFYFTSFLPLPVENGLSSLTFVLPSWLIANHKTWCYTFGVCRLYVATYNDSDHSCCFYHFDFPMFDLKHIKTKLSPCSRPSHMWETWVRRWWSMIFLFCFRPFFICDIKTCENPCSGSSITSDAQHHDRLNLVQDANKKEQVFFSFFPYLTEVDWQRLCTQTKQGHTFQLQHAFKKASSHPGP